MALVGAGLLTSPKVFAENTPGDGPMSTLIQKLADRFGLKEDEVRQVFEEERVERQAEREKRFEEKLDQAVANGELTVDQKKLIIAKRQELEANRPERNPGEFADMTEEERKTAMEGKRAEMETKRSELEAWAEKNGIDMKYLMGGFGMKGGHPGFR